MFHWQLHKQRCPNKNSCKSFTWVEVKQEITVARYSNIYHFHILLKPKICYAFLVFFFFVGVFITVLLKWPPYVSWKQDVWLRTIPIYLVICYTATANLHSQKTYIVKAKSDKKYLAYNELLDKWIGFGAANPFALYVIFINSSNNLYPDFSSNGRNLIK